MTMKRMGAAVDGVGGRPDPEEADIKVQLRLHQGPLAHIQKRPDKAVNKSRAAHRAT